jgi:hypothetical protein
LPGSRTPLGQLEARDEDSGTIVRIHMTKFARDGQFARVGIVANVGEELHLPMPKRLEPVVIAATMGELIDRGLYSS